MNTACVELRFLDDTMLAINTITVYDDVAANILEQPELDHGLHDLIGYADLILIGDPEKYLRQVTDYHPLDN